MGKEVPDMATENDPAENQPLDPLTASNWMLDDDDDILLAPPLEEFFLDLRVAKKPAPIAPPPKIDDIITGGYTGWVPIIRAGESLAEAERRAAEHPANQTAGTSLPEPEAAQPAVIQAEVVIEETEDIQVSVSEIVADPDTVTSPAQALDQARKRIAAMRASLQLNLNQVAESFSHPIFTPQLAQSTPPVVPKAVQQPIVDLENEPPASESVAPSEQPFIQFEQARVFTPTDTEPQPEASVQNSPPDHSLELMIMRDEIKDLRDRLDASQKLIEELMHRLANLAELALKR